MDERVLKSKEVLQLLLEELGENPVDLSKIGQTLYYVINKNPDWELALSVYIGMDGIIYPVVYSPTCYNPSHDFARMMTMTSVRTICPWLNKHPGKYMTIMLTSIELVNCDTLDYVKASATTSEAVSELLDVLRGNYIVPRTELGKAAMGALEE